MLRACDRVMFAPALGLAALAVVGALRCGAAGDGAAGASPARPAVLMITVDGLAVDDLAAFGGERVLPALDAFLAEADVWPRALTAVPMTRPGVASYLTGVAPDRHGVRDDLFSALPQPTVTLAERLAEAGYRTAAFPDSSYLGQASGLWRGFGAVNDPPPGRIDAARWLPRVLPAENVPAAFGAWLDTLAAERPWFGWVHLSHPLVGQVRLISGPRLGQGRAAKAKRAPDDPVTAENRYDEALRTFDEQLAAILAALDERGRREGTVVVLAGTLGSVRGGDSEPEGIGYSVDDAAVHVPVAIDAPAGVAWLRGAADPVWSLDVPSTIASLAGVALDGGAEGVSLTEPAPDGRAIHAWSWATLDQLGWEPLERVEIDGRVGIRGASAAQLPAELAAALDARRRPARAALPQELASALAADHGIAPAPLPDGGRAFPDAARRVAIADKIWRARGFLQKRNVPPGGRILSTISTDDDPRCYVSYLDRAHTLALTGAEHAAQVARDALALRPDDPDAWHWFAHALWRESWEQAEPILEAIEPYVPDKGDILYDLACTRSLAGDLDRSAELLEAAWEGGYRDTNNMEADPDLRNLRESGKFSEVMRRLN